LFKHIHNYFFYHGAKVRKSFTNKKNVVPLPSFLCVAYSYHFEQQKNTQNAQQGKTE